MTDPDEAGIVVLCTANVCRSPMAAALLARRLAAHGVTVPVRSAGMISSGEPPHPEVISVMASYGIQIASHRSRIVCAADLASAELVLAMAEETRQELRRRAVERVTRQYSWDAVADAYEMLFQSIMK